MGISDWGLGIGYLGNAQNFAQKRNPPMGGWGGGQKGASGTLSGSKGAGVGGLTGWPFQRGKGQLAGGVVTPRLPAGT